MVARIIFSLRIVNLSETRRSLFIFAVVVTMRKVNLWIRMKTVCCKKVFGSIRHNIRMWVEIKWNFRKIYDGKQPSADRRADLTKSRCHTKLLARNAKTISWFSFYCLIVWIERLFFHSLWLEQRQFLLFEIIYYRYRLNCRMALDFDFGVAVNSLFLITCVPARR